VLQEKNPVKIITGESGEVLVINEKKPEYASIGFEQTVWENRTGFLNKRRRVAFLASKVDDLKVFVEMLNLKPGSVLPGRIIVQESHNPFYEGQVPKVNPSTGATILIDGKLVYRQMLWDETDKLEDNFLYGDITIGDVITAPKVDVKTISEKTTVS